MYLSYNYFFLKLFCLFFANKVGIDDYGNTYYFKKIILPKIITEIEGLLFIMVL